MSNLRFQVVEEAFKKHALEVETPSKRPSEYFGKYVFDRKKMIKYLSKEDRTVAVSSMWPAEMDADRWIYVADTLVIPEKVTYEGIEYTVTTIGSGTFARSKIKHLVIPPSVREIKWQAFRAGFGLTDHTS